MEKICNKSFEWKYYLKEIFERLAFPSSLYFQETWRKLCASGLINECRTLVRRSSCFVNCECIRNERELILSVRDESWCAWRRGAGGLPAVPACPSVRHVWARYTLCDLYCRLQLAIRTAYCHVFSPHAETCNSPSETMLSVALTIPRKNKYFTLST